MLTITNAQSFIAAKIVDKNFGKILRNAYQNRTKGYYVVYIIFSLSKIEMMIDEMKQSISIVEELL